MERLVIRRATSADRTEIRELQVRSMRVLGTAYYSGRAIEAFIAEIGTMDDYLIDDQRYLVALEGNRIVGTGGWSTRRPSYDRSNSNPINMTKPRATVRSLYVHPNNAKRGIGRQMMSTIEAEIRDNGFCRAHLTATLSGVPLYERMHYVPLDTVSISLSDDIEFRGLGMMKLLCPVLARNRQAA